MAVPSPPASPLLQLVGVSKYFGVVPAVWKVHLSVASGECVALFGPNGAGKTTLLQLIAALLRPSEGEIRFSAPDRRLPRDRVGYVSHQSLLYNDLSGLENLLFYGQLYHLSRLAEKAEQMLQRLGLYSARNQLVGGYSRGMKQRLTLARALLHEPQLLLLDEPYAGLDQHGGRLLTQLLQSLKEEDRTILLVTHNLEEGLQIADRVLIQHRGRLVFEKARSELDLASLEEIYFRTVEH